MKTLGIFSNMFCKSCLQIGILNKEALKKKMERYGYISWLLALFSTIAYELLFLKISKELEVVMVRVNNHKRKKMENERIKIIMRK